MGFSFMEAFMDSLEVESTPGKGTLVKMSKIIGKGRENMDHTIDLIQKSHEGDEEAKSTIGEEKCRTCLVYSETFP